MNKTKNLRLTMGRFVGTEKIALAEAGKRPELLESIRYGEKQMSEY